MADVAAQVVGSVRKPAGQYAQAQFQQNELNEQLVAQGLPIGAEMVRKGRAWGTMTVTAAAGIVVRPSTLAALELWNGAPLGSVSLIIDRLFFFNLVSTAVVEGFSGWAQVTTTKAAPSSASLAVRGNSGKQGYTGLAVNAIGTTVLDNGWFPWGNAYNKAAGGVVPFGAIEAQVNGRLIVPPGSSLCLHVVSSLVGQTFTMGAMWYEELLSIE
jgi:hypothetical protein